jgi:hypothetical protein
MTVVRPTPAPSTPAPGTGRHARIEPSTPSGPLVPLRTVVRPVRATHAAPAMSEVADPYATLDAVKGRLVIDSSYSRLTPYLGARRVAVSVDGLPWRFAWGRTPIDLPAGRHLVEIEVEHGRAGRRPWGHVADAVPVAAGNTVEVFYRAPALPRLAGALGPERQRTAGVSLCALLLALAGLAALAALALAVLGVVLLLG